MKNRKPRNSTKPLKNTLKLALSANALIPLLLAAVTLTATAAQRPITDFTSRQGAYCLKVDNDGNVDCAASGYHGTSCVLFVPPQPNVGGWIDPKTAVFTLVDYAGLADGLLGGALGTTLDGSITEVTLPDGRAEVTVLLHTQNALTWASDVSTAFPGPALFGHTLSDVINGQDAALGSSLLQLKFKNTAPGAPLPDLIQLIFCPTTGQELTTLSLRAQATGTLRAASGVPDGTSGRLEVAQTGLLGVASVANSNSRVALDAFPAEHIVIQPTPGQ